MHVHSRSVRRHVLPAAVLASCLMALPLGLAACQDEQGGQAECLAAFRNAEPRALPPYDATALDDAIRTCRSYTDWLDAWEQVPGAHRDATDPRQFLEQRCAVDELADTSLCGDLAGT